MFSTDRDLSGGNGTETFSFGTNKPARSGHDSAAGSRMRTGFFEDRMILGRHESEVYLIRGSGVLSAPLASDASY